VFKQIKSAFLLIPLPMRRYWAGLIPLSVTEAVAEGLGAAAVYSLLRVMIHPAEVFDIPVISRLYTALSLPDEKKIIFSFVLMVCIYYVLKNFFLLAACYLRSRVTNKTIALLSTRLFQRYLNAPFSFHFHRNSAALIDRTSQGMEATVHLVLESVVAGISEILVLCGIIAVLVIVSPMMTLVSISLLAFLLGALLVVLHRLFSKLGAQEQRMRQNALQTMQQAFGALKEIKVMGRESFWHDIFSVIQNALSRQRRLYVTLHHSPRLIVETVFVCVPLIIIFFTMDKTGGLQEVLPLLGLFSYAGFRAIPSFNRLSMYINLIRYSAVEVDLLAADMELLGKYESELSKTQDTQVELNFKKRLVLDRVSFAYEGKRGTVLNEVNMTIHRGESIGIMGTTGSGKSTIIDLILGLLRPSIGRILVDDIDIQGSLASWRRKIGFVPQEIYLTDDTLLQNIAFGINVAEIDRKKVTDVIHMAQLDYFLSSLPEGLETKIGERGLNLSGGEKQRVAIARALYHEPELLIFDEATSALDEQTEQELAQAINALHGKKTMIIVAHRIGTLKYCDRIVLLQNGRIKTCGTPQELLNEKPELKRFVSP